MPLFTREQKARAVGADLRREESPTEYCSRLIEAFEEKADHKKRESIINFLLVTTATLLAPLFITLGVEFWLGKVIPSALSLIAAGSTGWLQLRQPQRLWSIYRTAQRELEDHRTKHHYGLGEYEDVNQSDKLLAENTADIALSVHYKWLPLVPSPENLKGFRARGGATTQANGVLSPPISGKSDETNE